jgi:hypothetical protein
VDRIERIVLDIEHLTAMLADGMEPDSGTGGVARAEASLRLASERAQGEGALEPIFGGHDESRNRRCCPPAVRRRV